MQPLNHSRNSSPLTQSHQAPKASQPRPRRAGSVRPQAALLPLAVEVAKTALTAGAMTGGFAGLVETLAPHGRPDARRSLAAARWGGTVGGIAGVGIAVPQALAIASGLPLGVVIGAGLPVLWLGLMLTQRRR